MCTINLSRFPFDSKRETLIIILMLLSGDLLLTSRTRNRDAKNKTRDQNFDDDSDDKLYNQKWLGCIHVLSHKIKKSLTLNENTISSANIRILGRHEKNLAYVCFRQNSQTPPKCHQTTSKPSLQSINN